MIKAPFFCISMASGHARLKPSRPAKNCLAAVVKTNSMISMRCTVDFTGFQILGHGMAHNLRGAMNFKFSMEHHLNFAPYPLI